MANRPVCITLAAHASEHRQQLWRLSRAAALLLGVTTTVRPSAHALAAGYGPAQATGYGPKQLISAYNVLPLHGQGLNGQGQTIAFIEIDGLDTADQSHFDSAYHLPKARLDVFVPE